jgi:predicted CoA-binding protein
MTNAREVLASAERIILVDWPSREVPETLVRAGYTVVVKSGPGPTDFTAQVREGDAVVGRPTTRPATADVVYAYRPPAEVPAIVALAREVRAETVWLETDGWPDDDRERARGLVQAAGHAYIDDVSIVDAALPPQ